MSVSKFIELYIPGDQREYVRLSSIIDIVVPKGITKEDVAPPDTPIRVHLSSGLEILTYGVSAFQILYAMMEVGDPNTPFLVLRDQDA